jgi:hypothetical protein
LALDAADGHALGKKMRWLKKKTRMHGRIIAVEAAMIRCVPKQ